MQEFEFLVQTVEMPLYAFLIVLLLPVGYFARIARKTVNKALDNEKSTD